MRLTALCATGCIGLALALGNSARAAINLTEHANCGPLFERGDVIAHVDAGGLIQFRVPGVANFQGHVGSHARDEFTLQGQFGRPRPFLVKDLKDVTLLVDGAGKPVTRFTPVTGLAIAATLNASTPEPGGFEDAVRFALDAHGPQIYNDVHYAFHLDAVVAVLERFGVDDPRVKIAAVLHDVIEDTPATYEEVRERFGLFVADAVRAVSLPGGLSRSEAFEIAYPAIRATPGALLVKLADRIANVEDAEVMMAAGDPRHFKKYATEYRHFKESLPPGPDATAQRMFDLLDRRLTRH